MVLNGTMSSAVVNTNLHQETPLRTGDFSEPIGTNWVMSKPIAVKFYVQAELMKDCEAVFERQGVKLSEGIVRLIRLLVESPDEMKPVVLGQAHGDAALALAESIISKRRGRGGGTPGYRLAGKPKKPPSDGKGK